MTPLTANLKHFYQSWRLIFLEVLLVVFYLMLGVVLFCERFIDLTYEDPNNRNILHLAGVFVLCAFTGALVAGTQEALLSKPFVFCLPGHRRYVVRHLLTTVGCLVSFLSALCSSVQGYSHLPFIGVFFWGIVAFCVGLSCYAAGAFYLLTGRFIAVRSSDYLVYIFVLAEVGLFACRDRCGGAAWVLAFPILAMSSFLLSKIWHRLEEIGSPLEWRNHGVFAAWSLNRMRRQLDAQRRAASADSLQNRAKKYVLKRMERSAPLSIARTTWGALYENVSRRQWHVSAFLFIVCLLLLLQTGYTASLPEGVAPESGVPDPFKFSCVGDLFLLFLLLNVCIVCLFPFHSALFLPMGRRERFWRSIRLAGIQVGVVMACYLVVAGLLHLGAGFMPPMWRWHFSPPHFSTCVWAIPTVSFFLLVCLSAAPSPKEVAVQDALPFVLTVIFILLMVLTSLCLPFSVRAETLPGFVGVLVLGLLLFGLWIVALRRRTYRGTL
ncbi:TPA: hypothetical protein DDW35_03975 [Candidatus Sumerlaeota bacterium]|jgi:hypothetical protein|nr:hypothetical protein [Candidatus Sumerlaeota bacterium]